MHIVGVSKPMQKAEFPCKECANRYPGCHDKCEKYRESLKRYRKFDRETDRPYVRRMNNMDRNVATRYKEDV